MPQLQADITSLYKGIRYPVAANRNRAFGVAGTIATAPTNSTSVALALASTTVKAGGIFICSVSLAWSGGTNGDTLTWVLTTQFGTTFVVANALQIGPGTNGAFVSSNGAGGGITIGGTLGSSVTQATETQPVLTGALAGCYTWTGIVQNSNSATTETPFTVGSNVAFILSGSNGAHQSTMTFNNVSISMLELM